MALKAKSIRTGFMTPLGFIEDSDSGTSALVMPNAVFRSTQILNLRSTIHLVGSFEDGHRPDPILEEAHTIAKDDDGTMLQTRLDSQLNETSGRYTPHSSHRHQPRILTASMDVFYFASP